MAACVVYADAPICGENAANVPFGDDKRVPITVGHASSGAGIGRVGSNEINSGNNFFHISRHAKTRRYPCVEEWIASIYGR